MGDNRKDLQLRKNDALKRLYRTMAYMHMGNGKVISSRAAVAAQIDECLSGVVNSQKWRDAVADWCRLVLDDDNDVSWAYAQGSVWFCVAIL